MKLIQHLESGIWHSGLPFKTPELQNARVDIVFSDGTKQDARLHVEAHETNPSLQAIIVIISGVLIHSSPSEKCQQLIALYADELSLLETIESFDAIPRFCIALKASRLAEAIPMPIQ